MNELALPSQEELLRIFEYDPESGILRYRIDHGARKAGEEPRPRLSHPYLIVKINGKKTLAQRVIWKMMTGEDPPETVDHIDRKKRNNRWSNLRLATRQQQKYNMTKRRDNKCGVKGVYKRESGRYRAQIKLPGGIVKHLGTFDTEYEAGEAYKAAAKEIHGDFYVEPS